LDTLKLPTTGPAVILLPGWIYDIHSYVDLAPILASDGYRVIVLYPRGYGTTRFLSSETFRNAATPRGQLDHAESPGARTPRL
jgi:pimeloyl-ACP methyl ester carboxylesterase